jgi:hypothetical protein
MAEEHAAAARKLAHEAVEARKAIEAEAAKLDDGGIVEAVEDEEAGA